MSHENFSPSNAAPTDGNNESALTDESVKNLQHAQQAQARLEQMAQQLTQVQAQLHSRSDELAVAEAQRDETASRLIEQENHMQCERLLVASGAIDTETASLLLSKQMDFGEPLSGEQIQQAVEKLLLEKPFLRASAQALLPSLTQGARGQQTSPASQLAQAADRAARSGNRKDIAEYLRLRRQTSSAP